MKIIKSATSEISRSSEARKKKEREREKKTRLLLRFADKKLQCTRNAAKNSRYCDLYLEILFSVGVGLFVMRQASNVASVTNKHVIFDREESELRSRILQRKNFRTRQI